MLISFIYIKMIKFACLLCLMIKGLSMRLIASSSEMESIKINGT